MTADSNRWVDGTLESGADPLPGEADQGDRADQGGAETSDLPNPETGVGLGASGESSFEPEEDPAG